MTGAAGGWCQQVWWRPWQPWLASVPAPPCASALAALNERAVHRDLRTRSGHPVRFVAAPPAMSAADYERRVFDTGEVATRSEGAGGWHDWFNALAWLRYPRTKARLNALQCAALGGEQPTGAAPPRRGRLRDALTLFDENALLVVAPDRHWEPLLRGHRWQELFVSQRARWSNEVRVLLFGHGLMQRMVAPYPSLCGKAFLVTVDRDLLSALDQGQAGAMESLDRCAAGQVGEGLGHGRLTPLPVLGIPGWWPPNESPGFYNDRAVFRPARPVRDAAVAPRTDKEEHDPPWPPTS